MKTLIFDFDGTLADSFELVMDIAYDLTGIERRSKKEVARLRKLPLLKAAVELHIPLMQAPRLLFKGRQIMSERIDEVHPFSGIPETLSKLHAAGYHLLVISSNSEKNVRTFLRAHDLESFFDGVYGNVALFNKAGSLRKVIKRNRLQTEDCFYIGDEVRDIVAATSAKVEPIAVSWGYQAPEALRKYHPYALLKEPNELLKLFPAGLKN
jgi:phosphoglycolate phosphatase